MILLFEQYVVRNWIEMIFLWTERRWNIEIKKGQIHTMLLQGALIFYELE